MNENEVCKPAAGVPVAEFTSPAIKVCSPIELIQALRSNFTRVVVPRDVDWNLTGQQDIQLHPGLQLVGERGDLASRPTLSTTFQPKGNAPGYSLFDVTGNGVRVEHLHLRGPKPASDHPHTDPYVNGINVVEDAEGGQGRNVDIVDNEFDLWSGGAVQATGTRGNDPGDQLPQGYDDECKPRLPKCPHLNKEDAGLVRVERNYMHHNVMHEGGYGVVVGGGAYVTVEGNVFDTNRHSVSASGKAYSGYVARFNYVLEGGYKQGHSYNQHFDVHGRGPGFYGGYAGEYFDISNNTIRGEQGYYCVPHIGCTHTRPAFMLRGTPGQGAFFHDNVVVHDDLDDAIALNGHRPTSAAPQRLLPTSEAQFNFHASGNDFDKDYTREIAAGDFDGDGRTDVFLATGTDWFFSRAGVRPWELLHESTKTSKDLGFADIDNDGVTDVFFRDGSGRLSYLKGGSSSPVPLNTSTPVPMKDLRFGDFDGDGRTDIFYTLNKQWRIWYGRNHRWSDAQTSVTPINELLFGEFDNVKGTDVAAVKNQGWSYSSAGLGSYTKFNGKLTDSFAPARAVDVDGNGKSDIVYNDGRYSRDGRGPIARLFNTGSGLGNWVTGHFDGGPRNEVVTFNSSGLLLVIARGPTSKNFTELSTQKMR